MNMFVEHLYNILQISVRSISQQKSTIQLSYILKQKWKDFLNIIFTKALLFNTSKSY